MCMCEFVCVCFNLLLLQRVSVPVWDQERTPAMKSNLISLHCKYPGQSLGVALLTLNCAGDRQAVLVKACRVSTVEPVGSLARALTCF